MILDVIWFYFLIGFILASIMVISLCIRTKGQEQVSLARWMFVYLLLCFSMPLAFASSFVDYVYYQIFGNYRSPKHKYVWEMIV